MTNKLFSGKVAFTLYDTYGFPLDLTQSILREKGIEVDVDEFNREMNQQKRRAKEAWAGSGDVKNNEIYFKLKEKIAETKFVGYEKNTEKGKILALLKNGVEVDSVKKGDEFEFFVDKTPFYGECGGQVGDVGLGIQAGADGVIPLPFSIVEVTNTLRPFPYLFLHKAKLESGSLKVGDYLNLSINTDRRSKIRANHSGVHLLLFALRKVFGDTVLQKGSYVDDKRLRFDFSLNRQIKRDELKVVEKIVNEVIFSNTTVSTKSMNLEEAKELGAMAMFNEKYEDIVRVVEMGESFAKTEEKRRENCNTIENVANGLNDLNNLSLRRHCSLELCGGTHVNRTGEIGMFKIIKEESIASGIRRIEAATGLEALNFLNNFQQIVENISDEIQSSPNEIWERIKQITTENKENKKTLESLKKAQLATLSFKEENGNILFAHAIVKDENPKDVKSVVMDLQNKKYNKNSVVACFVVFECKLTIMVAVSKDIADKISAVDLVKKAVEMAGGNGGGGQPWFAMGGANFDEKSQVKIENIIKEIKKVL